MNYFLNFHHQGNYMLDFLTEHVAMFKYCAADSCYRAFNLHHRLIYYLCSNNFFRIVCIILPAKLVFWETCVQITWRVSMMYFFTNYFDNRLALWSCDMNVLTRKRKWKDCNLHALVEDMIFNSPTEDIIQDAVAWL